MFFVVWNVLFCLYGLILSLYLLSLPSFTSIFCLVSSSSSCRAFSVLSKYSLIFRFCILGSCRSLFICDSNLSYHSGFDFCLWSSVGHQFFHRLVFLKRILNWLTPWCHLSGYWSLSRSLSWFRTWLPPVLVPGRKQCGCLFIYDSFNDIYIPFFLLGQCLRLCVCGV